MWQLERELSVIVTLDSTSLETVKGTGTMATVTFGYWKIRGLGNPIRFILEYTGTRYEEVNYSQNKSNPHESEWFKLKETLGFEFPNLPYLIDGDIKLTQSMAILKFIARKNYLCGKTAAPHHVEILEGCASDLIMKVAMLSYNPNFEKEKEDFLKQISKILKPYSESLGSKDWFLNNLSYLDFIFYEGLWRFQELKPDCMDEYPNLKDYIKRFENLEPIKKYMQSDRYFERPINSSVASYGAGTEKNK